MYYKEHDKPYLRRKSWNKAYNRRRDAISRGAPVLKHLHRYFKNKTVSQDEHEGLRIADRRKMEVVHDK